MNERLRKLREIGQSVWVDSFSRDDIRNGNLARTMEDGVLGVTSNPTIFRQAIARSGLYDEEFQELAEKTDDAREIFRRIAVRDMRDACDIFMPVYEQTEHKDGYMSLEVAPEQAWRERLRQFMENERSDIRGQTAYAPERFTPEVYQPP